MIAGTNWGGFAMLHQMQGAYYVKGFSKHGPLHNPHTYGYFDHVAVHRLQGRARHLRRHRLPGRHLPEGVSRPVHRREPALERDLLAQARTVQVVVQGAARRRSARGERHLVPAGRLDCTGRTAACTSSTSTTAAPRHLDPVDNWDKTNGRIYRIEYKGRPKYETFDLRKKTSAELAELLKHPNVWWRREAREILAERKDHSVHPKLRKWLLTEKGDLALESLWALYVSGGWMERDFDSVSGARRTMRSAPGPLRFLVDDGIIPSQLRRSPAPDGRERAEPDGARRARRVRPSDCRPPNRCAASRRSWTIRWSRTIPSCPS